MKPTGLAAIATSDIAAKNTFTDAGYRALRRTADSSEWRVPA
jgi:hypothetical protein